jgi:hypothetical protein
MIDEPPLHQPQGHSLGSTAPPRHVVRSDDADLPLGQSQGSVLLHIYEELTQHLGQMELTRDLLLAG